MSYSASFLFEYANPKLCVKIDYEFILPYKFYYEVSNAQESRVILRKKKLSEVIICQ